MNPTLLPSCNASSPATDTTKIQWTAITDTAGDAVPGYTFNPWEGCAKVSAGCANCYAETQHNVYYAALKGDGNPGTCWGINAPRLARVEPYWRAPVRWNKLAAAAQAAGLEVNRRRVFCASMADVFEAQTAKSASHAGKTGTVPTGKGTDRIVSFVDIVPVRLRLLRLIHDTPHLDWLLLTKRPQNIMPALQAAFAALPAALATSTQPAERKWYHWLRLWAQGVTAPLNVWLGTSVENQMEAVERIPHLLAATAVRRFLSCEPLLGPLDLSIFSTYSFSHCKMVEEDEEYCGNGCPAERPDNWNEGHDCQASWLENSPLDWIIVGGESGHRPRPQLAAWVRAIQKHCKEAGVPFLFKQLGSVWAKEVGSADKHGGKLEDIPAEFRVRESPASELAPAPAAVELV